MASLGIMAAGIAHEIGNPLTSISSIIQLMKRRLKDPQNQQYLSTIQENIHRISQIVKELVDFSRPSSEQLQPTDINKVVQSAVGIARYDRRARNIQFQVEFDPSLPTISLVADQLHQVILNMLVNALDAMEKQGDRITVRTYRENDNVVIEIQDTGEGIAPENLSRIFEPFFTTKEVGKGTGLGLTVSYGIVKKFGGDVQVKSQQGKGTTFRIVLPVQQKEVVHEP